jgi:hypothetical protein
VPGSGTVRVVSALVRAVITDCPVGDGLSTASDPVSASNTAVCAFPVTGRTTPAGASDTGGDTAASAGTIVGGGSSAGFDEHPVEPRIASVEATRPTKRPGLFDCLGKG